MPTDKVAIAFINKCWGVKGEVIAEPLTNFPQRLKKLKKVHVSGTRIDHDLIIDRVRQHGPRVVIKFEGIDDRDEANRLRNCYIEIDIAELHELPDGHFYKFDLIGLEVCDDEKTVIGKIDDIWEYPAGDILVVKSEQGRLLVPFLKKFIKDIDLKEHRMEVELLPGMDFEPE